MDTSLRVTADLSVDTAPGIGHYALMTGVSFCRGLLAFVAAVPLVFACQSLPASAACGGVSPSASVSGIVVSTSIDPKLGVIVDVHADDGTTRQVDFWGRNPTDRFGGTENTVEDAWAGSLPEVGGRYAITGDFNGDGEPITVTNCAQSPTVEVLSAPPPSTTTEASIGSSSEDGMSTWAVVGLVIGAGALLTGLSLLLRRRSRPASA
jgi:hypothetical protein